MRRLVIVPMYAPVWKCLLIAAMLTLAFGCDRAAPPAQATSGTLPSPTQPDDRQVLILAAASTQDALGRTLLSQPGLILLDEPLAGLDEPMQDRVLTLLQQVHAHWQLPMVLVSHDLAQVRRVASFAVTLEAGRVVHEGAINPPAVIAQDSHASRQDQEVNGATACNGRKGPRPSHTLSSHPLSQRFFH